MDDLRGAGLGARAASAVVAGDSWQVCSERRLRGRCVVLGPGRYASLASMGLDGGVVSAQVLPRDAGSVAADQRQAPPPAASELT